MKWKSFVWALNQSSTVWNWPRTGSTTLTAVTRTRNSCYWRNWRLSAAAHCAICPLIVRFYSFIFNHTGVLTRMAISACIFCFFCSGEPGKDPGSGRQRPSAHAVRLQQRPHRSTGMWSGTELYYMWGVSCIILCFLMFLFCCFILIGEACVTQPATKW